MKKRFVWLLALVLCLLGAVLLPTQAWAAEISGDVNGDGRIDTTDAKLIMQYDLGMIQPDGLDRAAADVNGDDQIDTTDAKLIMQLDLGIIPEFPSVCRHEAVPMAGKAPTCTQPGLTEGSCCGLCGVILQPQQSIPALGHSGELQGTQPADCTQDGYVWHCCRVCQEVYPAEVLLAAGHCFGPVQTVREAGCQESGLLRQTCTLCGFEKETVIPATGHNYQLEESDQDGPVTGTCPDCGKTVTGDSLEELYRQDEASYVFGCNPDFTFLVAGSQDADYIRAHLTILDAFFENTQYEQNPQIRQTYDLQDLGNGLWQVSAPGGYEAGNTYLARLAGELFFVDYPGNKLYFEVIGENRSEVKLAEDIIFIRLPQAGTALRQSYEMIASDDGVRFYLLIPQSEGITAEDVGRIVCFGDYATMDEIFDDATRECAFGKIEQVLTAADGRCMLIMGCPALEEVYEQLDVYENFTLALSKADIPAELGQQAVAALKTSDDFSRFIASMLLAAESYAADHGVCAEGVQDKSVLQKLVFYPTVKVVGQGVEVTITGKLDIPLKTEQGSKYGSISVSMTAKMTMSFDVKTVCQMKYFAFVPTGVQKFDFAVTQRTDYDFRFQVAVKLDSEPDNSLRKIYRSPYGVYHLENCKCVNAYTTGYLTACSVQEVDRAYRTTLGKTEWECTSCQPMTGYLLDQVYVINTDSGVVHCFTCASQDRMQAENLDITKQLPDGHSYSYCSQCGSEDFAGRDFVQRMADSLKYEQWGKVLKDVKSMLRSDAEQEPFKLPVLQCPIVVAHVFTVNFDVSLVLDFEFSGVVAYDRHYSTVHVYGVRRNADGGLDTYRASESESVTNTLQLMGHAQIKLGVRLDVYMSMVGLSRYVRVGIAAETGVYADLGGVLHLSRTESRGNGTEDADTTNYYAAYSELGLYADVQFSWKLLVWHKDSSVLGNALRLPLVIFGYDRVYYDYADLREWIDVTGTVCDLEDLQLLQSEYFDVRSQTTKTQLLSILGQEGVYGVKITLLDANGNEHPYAVLRDGQIHILEGAPCTLEVKVRIEILDLGDGSNWNEQLSLDKTALHNSTYRMPVYHLTICFSNHSLSDWAVVEEPTCLQEGLEERHSTCDCQQVEYRPIPALGHLEETIPAVEPTCTTDGQTVHVFCSRCDAVFVQTQLLPALGHRYADDLTCHDRPCLNAGCDHVEAATTEHIFSDWIALEPIGCSLVGYEVRYCFDCLFMDIRIPTGVDTLHPHQDLRVEHAFATCTEDGYAIVKCFACDTELAREVYPKTGHALGDYLYTGDGHYKVCGNFGCQYQTETEAHRFANACDPDCEACGYTRHTEHQWQDDYRYNTTHHWVECACCDASKDHGPHEGGTATPETKAMCQVCGASYGDYGKHEYTQQILSDDYLKQPADCEHPAQYYYVCACCGGTDGAWYSYGEPLGHLWQSDYSADATSHYYACDRCDAIKDRQPHSGTPATCQQKAWCDICRRFYGELADHSFDRQVTAEAYLAAEADCENPAKYYYSCACGEKGSATFIHGECLGHLWGQDYAWNEAGHWQCCQRCGQKSGQQPHEGGESSCQELARCQVCDAAYGSYGHHSWSASYDHDATDHWKSCSVCGEIDQRQAHYGGESSCDRLARCQACGADYGQLTEHRWSADYAYDESAHWRVCIHCGQEDRHQTHTGGGSPGCGEQAVCQVCGARYGAPGEHVFVQKNTDERYRKAEATCTDAAEYYYSCSCGERGEATFQWGQALGHALPDPYFRDEASHWKVCDRCGQQQEKGEHTGGRATCTQDAICAVCDYAYEKATGHNLESTYRTDSDSHWRVCASCAMTLEQGAHAGGQATCQTKAVCAVCDRSYGDYADHSYTAQNTDSRYLAKPADCTHPSSYYYSCVHCGVQGQETFFWGEALGHDWSDGWSNDAHSHWHACIRCDARDQEGEHIGGMATCTAKAICAVCQTSYGDTVPHSYTQQVTTGTYEVQAADCEREGIYRYSCVCGKADPEKTFTTPALGHVWSTGYMTSADAHWYFCTRSGCDGKSGYQNHYGGIATCQRRANCIACMMAYGALADHRYTGQIADEAYLATPANCEQAALYYYCCSNCGAKGSETFVYGDPLGHAWSAEWTQNSQIHYRRCENGCGKRTDESVHSFGDFVQIQPPTCTETGLEESRCSVCDYGWQRKVEKVPHTMVRNQPRVEATTKDGVIHYIIQIVDQCSVCGYYEVISEGQTHAHNDYAILKGRPQTCTQTGLTFGAQCNVAGCGQILIPQEELPALGHDYVNGTCTRCGEKEVVNSTGLAFTLSGDGTYYIVSGIGTCTDTDLMIPDTYNGLPVKEIGKSAFFRCTGLESVVIPDSVQVIGESAFSNCTALKNVHIGTGLKALGGYAFNECTALEQLRIDAVAIDDFTGESWTFHNAGKNSGGFTVTFGASVTKVPDYLFYQYYSYSSSTYYVYLTNVVFEADSACKTIGAAAFRYCMGLTQITLPAGLQYIENSAFDCCWNLTSVDMGNEVLAIGDHAFGACGFSTITLSSKLKTIGADAFSCCDKLTQIVIPDSVESIGECAFYECGALKEITIGKGVVTMGDNALWYCRTLETIYFNAAAMEDMEDGSSMVYLAGIEGSGVQLIIGANVQRIPAYFCNDDGRSKLVTVTFASGSACLTIGDYAFAYCDELASVTLGESLTYIGSATFLWCESLTSISIPDTVTTIAGEAFCCAGLESITLGTGLEVIDFCAFTYCESLTSITIPANVSYIGAFAFEGCSALRQITFLGNAPEIDYGAFNSVTATVYYPKNNSTWTETVRQNYGGTLTWKKK